MENVYQNNNSRSKRLDFFYDKVYVYSVIKNHL